MNTTKFYRLIVPVVGLGLSNLAHAIDDTPAPSALNTFIDMLDWRLMLGIVGIMVASVIALAWQRRLCTERGANWLNGSALSLGILGLTLTIFWAVQSPDDPFLPIVFMFGFIGMYIGREITIHQTVEFFLVGKFARAGIAVTALFIAYVALYGSGFFHAINSSGDAAKQRLEGSHPALALDLQIENTQQQLMSMAGYADASRAQREAQQSQQTQQAREAERNQLVVQLAAANARLKGCPANHYTVCINPAKAEIASIQAQIDNLQTPINGSAYAANHNQYLGLKQHLADLQQQRAALVTDGNGVKEVWKSEDRFLSWLFGITPEQANSVKWLVLTFIFDLLSLLFRIIASLTLHNASAVMIAQRKFNALISAGFSLPEIIKMLGSDSELMQAMSAPSNPTNQPTKASTAKSEALHSYHEGGRVREVETDANGEQHAVLRKHESVLNEGATAWLDTNARGLIDKLNAAFSSTTQKSNEPVPAPDPVQAPEVTDHCQAALNAMHKRRGSSEPERDTLPNAQDVTRHVTERGTDTGARHVPEQDTQRTTTRIPEQGAGAVLERVPSHLSQVSGKGRVGKLDSCKYCGGDYVVKAWNAVHCSPDCAAKSHGFENDVERRNAAKRSSRKGD